MTVSIPARGANLHGHFSRELAPVVEIDPGETITVHTLDAWWSAGPYQGGSFPDRARVAEHHPGAGHALTGPILVRGARAGATLAVRMDEIVPAEYGTTFAGRRGALDAHYGIVDTDAILTWELDPHSGTGRNNLGHTVTLRPFLGVVGLAPAEPGRHSTIPPRRTGGNLDCKELVTGSTLYLPVAVDGALLSVGDGHARQGDGEVGGTAIECPMTSRLTIDVRDDLAVTGPVAETAAGWLTLGVADTVDDAVLAALNAMFDLMQQRFGLRRAEAVALASVIVDVRVTQIVNQVVGAHAILPHDAVR
jgi:acetamidase/formamidase